MQFNSIFFGIWKKKEKRPFLWGGSRALRTYNGETDKTTIMMEIYDRPEQYMMLWEYIIYTASA